MQIDPDEEILILDDHSPSGVPDFDCPCTRVIQPKDGLTPHIYRLNTLRNLGMANAKNDLCIILDPDCVPNPSFIRSAKALFDPSILYAGCVDRKMPDNSMVLDRRIPERVSRWIDTSPSLGGGGLVWGGIMMFSKSRVTAVGGFDEEFDGSWGAEEHEFASRCYNSGMRLYYSMELAVTHLPHPAYRPSPSRNMALWTQKAREHEKALNHTSPYKPAVGVSVITMMRPTLIDQCLRAIFRSSLPVRVRLVVNGDDSEETKKAVAPWKGRWAIKVVEHGRKWPAVVRNESLEWSRKQGFRYHVFIDDDITVFPDSFPRLAWLMVEHPETYACSGFIKYPNGREMMLGGPLVNGAFSYLKKASGIHPSSWVGGGFTIHRLDPLIPYDGNYETGYNDYDWSMEAIKQGKKLAVCGDAGAWHGAVFTKDGVKDYTNPTDYKALRYDDERHARMRLYFKSKWGFEPRTGKVIE